MIQKIKMFLIELWIRLTAINCGGALYAYNGDAGKWLHDRIEKAHFFHRSYSFMLWHTRVNFTFDIWLGKRFYLPKGTYRIFTNVEFPKDSTIYCFGNIEGHGGTLLVGGNLTVYGNITGSPRAYHDRIYNTRYKGAYNNWLHRELRRAVEEKRLIRAMSTVTVIGNVTGGTNSSAFGLYHSAAKVTGECVGWPMPHTDFGVNEEGATIVVRINDATH